MPMPRVKITSTDTTMYKRQTRLKRTGLVEGRVGIASLDNHGLLGIGRGF